jgi:hypothetical protein
MQIQQSFDKLETEGFVLTSSPVHLGSLPICDEFMQSGGAVIPQNDQALILLVLIQPGLHHECFLVGISVAVVLLLQRFLQHGHLIEPSFESFILVAVEGNRFY